MSRQQELEAHAQQLFVALRPFAEVAGEFDCEDDREVQAYVWTWELRAAANAVKAYDDWRNGGGEEA